jgi:rubrerythrin
MGKLSSTNNLAFQFPEIAKDLHLTKNIENGKILIASNCLPFSNKQRYWICSKGHEYLAIVANRTKHNSGCPSCAKYNGVATLENNLAVKFPDLLLEWNWEENNKLGLDPFKLLPTSNFNANWVCKLNHKWLAPIGNRTGTLKRRCLKCYKLSKFGSGHPNWKGGISNFPYPIKFNRYLKSKIRKRDNFICQGCGMIEKDHKNKYKTNLHIHHIDHNVENCDMTNLITVCISCNTKANYNIEFYLKHYQKIIKELYE